MTQRKTQQVFQIPSYYSTQKITFVLTTPIIKSKASAVKQAQAKTLQELATADERVIYLRDGDVVLYKVNRSNNWHARFRARSGKWVRFSTKRGSYEDAKRIACDKYDEAKYRERLGYAMFVKRFDEMADYCVTEMRRDLANGTGKKVYTAYIAVIETYLKEYFGQMYLTSITHKDIKAFEEWRNEQLGRVPKVSTLLTFATAYTRIIETARAQGWISESVQIPKLGVVGERGVVRPAFTDTEVVKIRERLATWYTELTGYKMEMRKLLRDLVDVLILTGMRQGTESMSLKWKSIAWYTENNVRYLRIWVSGKTGGRWLIAKHECVDALKRLHANQKDIAHLSFDSLLEQNVDKLVFRFANGDKPFEMNKVFRRLLIEMGLVKSMENTDRTLYSLRHTYATKELLNGTYIHTLARQMGTSVVMLERHYSKLTATMAAESLA